MSESIVSCEVEIEAAFFDVDLMEIVWHGNYAKYFEVARCALLDKIDYGYMKMRESGYGWPVIDLRIRYVKPIMFGQKIKVQAQLMEWENRLKITYQIFDKNSGVRLTRGYTTQIAVDMTTREMCYESPTVIWQKLGIEKP